MRDLDNLTPLDARNSLLLDRKMSHQDSDTFSLAKTNFDKKETAYQHDPAHDNLVSHAAPIGVYEEPAGGYYGPPRGYDARLGGGYQNGYNRGY